MMGRVLVVVACAAWWVGCGQEAQPPTQEAPDAGYDADPDLVIEPPDADGEVRLEGLAAEVMWPAAAPPDDAMTDCIYASPLHFVDGQGAASVLVVGSDQVRGLDPETGAARWSVTLPAPDGNLPLAVATPVMVEIEGRAMAVVAYHTSTAPAGRNVSGRKFTHMAVVVDLAAGALAEDFAPVTLEGSVPANEPGREVPFLADHALARATLVHAGATEAHPGYVYVTMGNTRDIQPWHGFLFELDLGAWRAQGPEAAIRTLFVTTPEADCGVEGHSGSRERRCGGGLWAPSGPLLIEREGAGPELILASGNGQLDLRRRDYANTMMRVVPGADPAAFFDPGCDPFLCAEFNPDDPQPECVTSCANLWVPQLDEAAMPQSDTCAGLTPFQCWGALDYIGGSTPVMARPVGGPEVLAYPTKDGAIYLVDAAHLGVQYDRRQLVPTCGVEGDPCRWDWAGMIVTQPALTEVDGDPVVLVPTFMPDNSQPAGVVALKIVMEAGAPRFAPLWQFPRFDTVEATNRFRRHPSRVRLATVEVEGEAVEVAFLVEARAPGDRGRLLALEVATGRLLLDTALAGPGYRFMQPLVLGDRIFVTSCQTDEGPGYLEAFRFSAQLAP